VHEMNEDVREGVAPECEPTQIAQLKQRAACVCHATDPSCSAKYTGVARTIA
jgi:hypothetical protein